MSEQRFYGPVSQVAAGNIHNHLELPEGQYWNMSEAELQMELERCLSNHDQARAKLFPWRLLVYVLIGAAGAFALILAPRVVDVPIWLAPVWIIGWSLWLRTFGASRLSEASDAADFERLVMHHYKERIIRIRLVQRDKGYT